MAANPMHQFQVYRLGPEIKLGNVDLSFTNASLFMLISALSICIFLYFGSKQKSKLRIGLVSWGTFASWLHTQQSQQSHPKPLP